jgi:hypothetical protein
MRLPSHETRLDFANSLHSPVAVTKPYITHVGIEPIFLVITAGRHPTLQEFKDDGFCRFVERPRSTLTAGAKLAPSVLFSKYR